jgi:H+-transporting ATPase
MNPIIIDTEKAKDISTDDILSQLNSSPATGLTSEEHAKRIEAYGKNEITEEKESALLKFLKFFWGPIPWMIEAAAILSLIAKDFNDFGIILFMLIFNGLIGFWEEHKASNALAALKSGLALKARAFRDSKWAEIDASDIVPGDIIRVRLGDVVPADGKLLEGDYLSIDQAALTGESLPVNKKVGDIIYSGSVAKQGEMTAVVTSTGVNTFFGRTAKLVEGAGNVSHFQQAVMRVGNFLIALSIVLCVILSAVVLYRDHIAAGHIDIAKVISLAKFVLILAIASIPVAMPAVLSVTMALGALAMSKQKAIVSRLQAIEEMAGVDILCSDKTGTLTKNQLTLDTPMPFGGFSPDDCILYASLASKEENNDAIDLAMIAGLKEKKVLEKYKQTKFTPFDPVSKRTESIVITEDNKEIQCTKGAPQVIIEMSSLKKDEQQKAEDFVNELAAKGYRALGVAKSTDKGKTWEFLGIIPMFDPPRDDSAETIKQAIAHGLRVKMVTGDDIAIGSETSKKLGMGSNLQSATAIFEGQNPDHLSARAAECIDKADGFGRVFPEHKYGIVKALQSRNHIVAMTGDGVNDAPALKQADAGIAVSGATDAARAAAALILTAPGLSVIIQAIETARQIFERMMSYTIYRIAMTMDVMFFVVLSMIIFPTVTVAGHTIPFQPLTAVMIIILALLDDIPIMTIAYDNTIIDPKPVRWEMGRVLAVSSTLGVMAVLQTFGLLFIGMYYLDDTLLGVKLDPSHIQTMIFLQLVVGGHLMLFLTRTKRFFFLPPFPSAPLFLAIVGTQIFAAVMCGFGWLVPALPWTFIGVVWCYNLAWMLIQDIVKKVTYQVVEHRAKHQKNFFGRLKMNMKHHAERH